MADEDDLAEVFQCTYDAVAQIAIDEVLRPAGIPATVHNRTSKALPAPASMMGDYYVAVPRSRAAEAITALNEAQEAGVLSDDGEVAEAF
jgi:hypothetical protein